MNHDDKIPESTSKITFSADICHKRTLKKFSDCISYILWSSGKFYSHIKHKETSHLIF